MSRGSIFVEDAYAQGKMLDHSGWDGALTRAITPSDIDMAFDASGKIIFVELSSSCVEWRQIDTGQRLLYERAITGTLHCACLCKHAVPISQQINSRNDVMSFQIMIWNQGPIYSPIVSGNKWAGFVERWVNTDNGPHVIRHHLIRAAAAPPLAPTSSFQIGANPG